MTTNLSVKYRIIFLVFLLMMILSACGESSETSNQENEQESSGAEDKETFNLKMNVAFPPVASEAEPKHTGVEEFAKLVNERTDGRVNIEIFYSSQLVPDDQALEALAAGTVDINATGAYWSDQIPTQDFAFLPFAFHGSDHIHHLLRETELGEIFESNLEEHGAKVLMYWPSGTQGIMSKDPITSLEDMKGKTFRAGTGLWTTWYGEMGVAPAKFGGPEAYEALMRGTIDGTTYPYYTLDTHKFHEVVDHITLPGILDPVLVVNYMSLKTWNDLPEDIQTIMIDVAKELEPTAIEKSKKMTENAIEIAEENDVAIHILSDEELEKFVESAQSSWEEFASKSEDTKRMVEIIEESQEEFKKN